MVCEATQLPQPARPFSPLGSGVHGVSVGPGQTNAVRVIRNTSVMATCHAREIERSLRARVKRPEQTAIQT